MSSSVRESPPAHPCSPSDGALHMECHDRYFMIAVALSFTGEDPRFEAVDRVGVHPITKQNEAKCGYCVTVLPLLGHVELRGSYFSCHTDRDDGDFTFSFNLITSRDGKEVVYPLNKTCSPTLPWSPREVTCAINYMEVLLQSESSCSVGMKTDQTAVAPTPGAVTSDWQVTFEREQEQMPAMNLSEARRQGYMFDLTDGLIVFRTSYGQPDSFMTEVNGIPVEKVQATLFSKQGWLVLMVEVVAACSMYSGSYDDGHMLWKTPEVLYSGLSSDRLRAGLNGELVDQSITEKEGYLVKTEDGTVEISIRYDAAGGYRKSFVAGNLYEFYLFHFFLEQVLLDEDDVKTVVRFHRALITPLLHCPIYVQNQTVLEEQLFTVYLGEVPEDVTLTGLQLNGYQCDVLCSNTSTYNVTEVVHANNTRGYTLKVPFSNPFVIKQFFSEDSVLQYRLDINYTLSVEPQNEVYFHMASIVAVFTGVSPPVFEAVCLDSGISFKLDHKPFDYLWDVTIGSELLTSEMADRHGYIMTNDSQTLQLEVPLFTPGYTYADISLKGFVGTFEILVQDGETSAVQTSTVKKCSFTSSELIVCSTDGRMTVVADVSLAIPKEGKPASTTLADKYCGPKDADESRALFMFPLSSCGTIVKIGKKNVTYQNEIFYKNYYNVDRLGSANDTERVIVQCTYPLASLHLLFSRLKFESDAVGTGRIIHTKQATAGLKGPAIKPTVAPETTPATKRPPAKPVAFLPPVHRPGRYFSRFYNLANRMTKGTNSSMKMYAVQV
ncbi:zona pellucida protein AX 4 [Salarias fasciatus]|uniref:zona pellucida protein AX 4 n=1 Tax=Salarias fasciatus TaxID=181472 RepID=UPI001176C374|nr:uncharacterized protein LOC115386194 [Salarias fasciatus]